MRWNCRQARTTNRVQRRADGINFPAEKKFRSRRANASLAGAHAAAGVQFRGAPGGVLAQAFVRDVFAATDQRVLPRKIIQLRAQWESVFKNTDYFLVACALRK